MSQISFVGLVALDEILLGRDVPGSSTVGDIVEDPSHDPVAVFEVDEMKHLLADAINRAPRLASLFSLS